MRLSQLLGIWQIQGADKFSQVCCTQASDGHHVNHHVVKLEGGEITVGRRSYSGRNDSYGPGQIVRKRFDITPGVDPGPVWLLDETRSTNQKLFWYAHTSEGRTYIDVWVREHMSRTQRKRYHETCVAPGLEARDVQRQRQQHHQRQQQPHPQQGERRRRQRPPAAQDAASTGPRIPPWRIPDQPPLPQRETPSTTPAGSANRVRPGDMLQLTVACCSIMNPL